MTAPRLEIDLDKIHHNARTLVDRLGARGISVTGVTKAVLGAPEIAAALIRAGVVALGDSRIGNIATLRGARIVAPIMLIRSPMLSQVEKVVAQAETSFNTELDVVSALSQAAIAARRTHGIMLMVELGDLREGIMPGDLESFVHAMLDFPGTALRGIGTNLACRSGVAPDARNMAELSVLADSIDATFGHRLRPRLGSAAGSGLEIVSGGNSANLQWALSGADTGRINDLRLGEAILLGCEPLRRQPIEGLYTDAFTLIAEVIETKVKPSKPWGDIAQTAFGATPTPATDRISEPAAEQSRTTQTILALGRQDIDPDGLLPPAGIDILGASSDHLIVDSGGSRLSVGAEVRFQLNYSALLRAMTSPFVVQVVKTASGCRQSKTKQPPESVQLEFQAAS
ncbi:alanine/ornithine racemase family PLP-dependent enzyme [Pelagibius marinus]|uniref:alanine/ornithine racemase family PLP-dependent enzyme n=1 Tax=Pelagibius marinus TaxID=2762760 RepID=UPI001872FF7E|nr:alanine/ornithine racemase family PLP-dependent enzyme [Pelagibius marinus]